MHEEQLKELGLSENEAEIYILLLQHGMLSPGTVSEKLGLHRGYTYDTLERMQEKQVASSILKNNKKHYQAARPEHLAELLQLKLERFRTVLPDLKRLQHSRQEDTDVSVHTGRAVYRTVLKDIIATLTEGETVLLTGIDERTLSKNIEPIYLKQYLNIIRTKHIKERIIIKRGGKRFRRKNLEYKELDDKYLGNITHIVYGGKIALFIDGTPRHMVFIENEEVADTYRRQFELLWEKAT